MTRESKLALMIAVTLILLVGVLLSDHFSGAAGTEFDAPEPARTVAQANEPPGMGDPIPAIAAAPIRPLDPAPEPGLQPPEQTLAQTPIAQGPIEIWQGPVVQEPEQSPLSVALGGVDNAIERMRNANPPALVGDGGMFEPVTNVTVVTQSRNRDQDRPTKPIAEPETPRSAQPQTEAREEPRPAERWETHTVAPGDSLFRLAEKHLGDGKRWRELQRLNADLLGDSDVLKVGMELKIARAAAPAARPAPSRPATDAPPAREYVVLPGDSLGAISQKLLGTVRRMDDIVRLNGLKDPDDIRVGQTLRIPAR